MAIMVLVSIWGRALREAARLYLLIVDELGYLETRGEGFAQGVNLAKQAKNSLVVIRSELLPAFLPLFNGSNPLIQAVTPANRDNLPGTISPILLGLEPAQ